MNEKAVCAVFIKVLDEGLFSCFSVLNFKHAGHCFVFVSEKLMFDVLASDGCSGHVFWFLSEQQKVYISEHSGWKLS